MYMKYMCPVYGTIYKIVHILKVHNINVVESVNFDETR